MYLFLFACFLYVYNVYCSQLVFHITLYYAAGYTNTNNINDKGIDELYQFVLRKHEKENNAKTLPIHQFQLSILYQIIYIYYELLPIHF